MAAQRNPALRRRRSRPGFQLGRMHGRLPAKLVLIARHARKVCEGLEGVVDGIVANRAAYTAKLLAAKHSA